MRTTLQALLRVVGGFVATGAGWAPAALFAVWGGTYLVRCVQTLEAPGVPVEYKYESESGTVLVAADAYSFDVGSRQGALLRVRAVGPDGTVLAQADSLDFVLDGDVFVVRVFDPVIRVKRLSDGSFDIGKYLPKQIEEETEGGAFRVYANRATLHYSDESVAREPMVLALSDLGVDGADGSFLFNADFESDSLVGRANGSYTKEGRLWCRLSLDETDAAPLIPYVNEFIDPELLGEFADVSARSLRVDGSVDLWHDQENGAKIAANLNVEGEGVRSGETLRNARVSAFIRSDGTITRMQGRVAQNGITAQYDGDVRIANPFRMTGRIVAHSDSRDTLPPLLAQFVDPEVVYESADFDGNMDTDGESFFFDGSFSVATATYAGETTTGTKGRVRLDPRRLTARLDEGRWSGVDYSGAVNIEFETGALSGGLRSERGRLEPIAEHFGTDRLKGIVSANAVLGGTIAEPTVDLYARGSGGVQVTEGPLMSLGVFELRGKLDGKGLHLERLTTNGENGVMTAKGSMLWEDGALNFQVDAGSFDVASLADGVSGFGFLKARVGGTREAPTATGRAEVYGLKAFERTVPQLIAEWSLDKDRMLIERLAARAGTGQIDGTGSLTWETRALNGQFSGSGVRLEEWLSPHTVGAVAVENGTVSGTIDEPLVTATLRGTQLFAGGIDLDEAFADLRGDKDGVRVPSFFVRSSSGELTGTANFGFGDKKGRLDAEFTDVPLTKVPRTSVPLTLDGLAKGKLWAEFGEDGVTGAELDAEVDMVNVNGTPLGRGSLFAALDGRKLTGEAQIGSLERYILLSDAGYDLDTEEATGEVYVYNVLLEDVLEASQDPIKAWPNELKTLIENTKGLLNAGIAINGPVSNPMVDVLSLTMSDLRVRERDAGLFRASALRRDGVWTLRPNEGGSPVWENGEMKFWADGTMSEAGEFAVKGELRDFRATWLNTLFPNVPLIAGRGSLTFDGSGTLDDPTGTATLNATGLGAPETKEGQTIGIQDLLINVEDKLIDFAGTAHTGSAENPAFKGNVHGLVPFSSLYEIEGEPRQPMTVQVDLERKTFADFANFLTSIDAEQSVGTVEGSAWIVGLLGDFTTHAELRARGSSLLIAPMESPIRLVNMTARWDNGTASVSGTFSGDQSGTGALDVRAIFPDLFAENITVEDIKQQTTLDGALALTNYRARFTLPTAERASGATITTTGFGVSGTLAQPVLKGDIELRDLYVRLPNELAEGSEPVIYPIDPLFDGVTIRAAEGSRLDSGNARIDFFGAGRLGGSLQNPDITVPLTVTGGVFDLPTARVTLESGGTINIGYRSLLRTAPTARVDLNLEGRTTLSARRVDNEYETYLITLHIRGDLLDQEGLIIQASSDPPDLSSEHIMAILGQKELIENFARHGSDEGFRESLYTVGVPTASNALTTRLARDLGLDYISLDYNPFDQTVAGVGKTIGRGLMIHANRQLSPQPGDRLKYEVQLTYRLPMRDPFFSRVRLGFGLDQDVPWRIRLNWARRF